MRLKRVLLDKRICRLVLLFYFVAALIPSVGEASLIESRLSSGEQMSERAEQIQSVRKAIEHKIVAQKLADYGLSQEEVMARMNALDDRQLHQLASLSHEIGGGDNGTIIVVLLVLLLVILTLNLFGKRITIR